MDDLTVLANTALGKSARNLLQKLLGAPADELGELIADKVRLRRFRNQVAMLSKVREILKEAGLEPQAVPLKTLLPLVSNAELEEDKDVQSMWANLLASAATSDFKVGIHAIAIQVLASISPTEALMLRILHDGYEEKRVEFETKQPERSMPASFVFYRPNRLLGMIGRGRHGAGDFLIDNLVRLGVIRWTLPDPEDAIASDFVELTELGLRVVQECVVPASASG